MANKYQNLNQSQAELDFHDFSVLTKEEIIKITDDFINDAQEKSYQRISFIVGQGKHSKNGAVIKPLLEKYLTTHPEVSRVQKGKFNQGGEGVLVVDLS
ncbi:Smr/MutS family protein [Candidatus Nomurabacteria bacterium]|nr:Smr/MutS family protein [Candidatus Nomurabacteria bacterium]